MQRLHEISITFASSLVALLFTTTPVAASCEHGYLPCGVSGALYMPVSLKSSKPRALQVRKYRFDGGHAVTGWQIRKRWYVGRYKGGPSKFALVRDAGTRQYSIGRKGIAINLQF